MFIELHWLIIGSLVICAYGFACGYKQGKFIQSIKEMQK